MFARLPDACVSVLPCFLFVFHIFIASDLRVALSRCAQDARPVQVLSLQLDQCITTFFRGHICCYRLLSWPLFWSFISFDPL